MKSETFSLCSFKSYFLTIPYGSHKGDQKLIFWNEDGTAKGKPENFELFLFEFADPNHSSVVIRNISGPYVRYAPPHFVCDADRESAAIFYPEFD